MTPVMTEAELREFMYRAFPQAADDFHVERLTPEGIVMRLRVAERHLRPGGTISGPTMFGLADVAIYLAILARIGPVALAVTTSGTIDFLRKPAAGVDLLGEARLLKLGKVLAVGDVLIRSEGVAEPVARSSMTYSIPPQR
jgi:uncharacterized protein (TIGR00369 family)